MRKLPFPHSGPSSRVHASNAERPGHLAAKGAATYARPISVDGQAGVERTTELCTTAPRDDEWQSIADALAPHSRFATAAWIRAWGESLLPYQNWRAPLRYLTVRADSGRLLAVFPFAMQRQSGIPVSSLAGFYWPYRTPVIPENAAAETFDALACAFTRSAMVALRYGPVPVTNRAIGRLNAALESQGWRVRRSTLGTTFSVGLPATWEQYERNLGKSLRFNAQYYERKMQREGALEIRCSQGASGRPWSDTVRDLALIEAKSWQQRAGGKPRFFGERNQAFWTSVLSDPAFGRMASVWLMYFDAEPVSSCFCLDCADTRHIVANHYAEHVRGYSTGSVLYRHVFRDAIESGTIRCVDIGLGDSGYKSRWGAQPSFELVDWIAFRPGARGRLLDLATKLHRSFAQREARPSERGDAAEPDS